MRQFVVFLLAVVLVSCGTQKRLTHAKQVVEQAKQIQASENQSLNTFTLDIEEKAEHSETDSIINNEYHIVLKKLDENLKKIEKKISLIELSMQDKSNFKKAAFNKQLARELAFVDSFNLSVNKRQEIYTLLREAIKMKAFSLVDLAAFFGSGKYRIPVDHFDKVRVFVEPIIDSMAAFSNKFKEVPHIARMVFVGYADAIGVKEGSELYNELAWFLKQEAPTKEKLNMVLSDLRAKELLAKTKTIMTGNVNKFSNYNHLKIGYSGYGLGEKLPFKSIKDYKEDDERRRIVLFYWCILPDKAFL
ncbi:MAG: hypothetical protein IPH58_06745 [Sphingobacteriales bacterium]|jgi:hypothetical protein|nr:hypothetical protein [Sphingobacteriales bacterium]